MASRESTLAERVQLYLRSKGEDVFLVRVTAEPPAWQTCEIENGEVVVIWHEDESWSAAVEKALIGLNRMFDDENAAMKAWELRERQKDDET